MNSNNFRLHGITLILGAQGAGKTLSATLLAYHYYSRLHKHIYANYKLNFPHKTIGCLTDLEQAENGLLILDEAYTIVDARRSMTNQSLAINTILQHARKRDFDVCVLTQILGAVDKRVRLIARKIIVPHFTSAINGGLAKLHWDIYTPNKNVLVESLTWKKSSITNINIGQEAFNLFDSYAPIYDFTAEAKDMVWKKAEEMQEAFRIDTTQRGVGVESWKGKDKDHPGKYDITLFYKNKVYEVDVAGHKTPKYLSTKDKGTKDRLDSWIAFYEKGGWWMLEINEMTFAEIFSNGQRKYAQVGTALQYSTSTEEMFGKRLAELAKAEDEKQELRGAALLT